MRKSEDCLKEEIMRHILAVKREEVEFLKSWNKNLIAWTGLMAGQLIRQREERLRCRKVRSVVNPRIQDAK